MADRERVIKWLDVCKTADRAVGLKEDYPCRECPYKDSPRCMRELVADALELLKEQDAVQPLYTTTSHPFHVGLLYHCGNCHESLERDRDLFCRRCGKPIDWEKGAVKWE